MISQDRRHRRRAATSGRRPLIGVRGGVAATVTLALLLSADVRTRALLALADAASLMTPPRLSASTESPIPADDGEAVRRLTAECLRLRRIVKHSVPPLLDAATPIDLRTTDAEVLWTTDGGRDAVLSLIEAANATDGGLTVSLAGRDVPHVAAGGDDGVSADALGLAGRTVVGRVGTVGRRSATLVPVTSPEFRVDAELVRGEPGEPVVGAAGTYVGGGEGGTLTMVPVEEPVNVGDEVYTRPESTWCRDRLAIGTVVEVEDIPGEPHWRIRVRPHADLRRHDVVRIVSPVADPAFFAADGGSVR